jgi:hypothetical protein
MKKLIMVGSVLLSGCATTRTYGTCYRTNTLFSDDGDSKADVYVCKVVVTSPASAESSDPKPNPSQTNVKSQFDQALPVGG